MFCCNCDGGCDQHYCDHQARYAAEAFDYETEFENQAYENDGHHWEKHPSPPGESLLEKTLHINLDAIKKGVKKKIFSILGIKKDRKRSYDNEAEKQFARVDTNHDKFISIEEAERFFQMPERKYYPMKRDATSFDIQEEMRKLDENGDGFLSPNEFDESLQN